MAAAEPKDELNVSAENQDQIAILKTLWLLTACQDNPNSKREFDVNLIANRVLGLLGTISFQEIIIHLQDLFPIFDKDQKIVANFIILQLLFHHTNDKIQLPPEISAEIRAISVLNSEHLGKLGEQINQHLEKALDLSSLFTEHRLLRNFYLLNRAISTPSTTRTNRSFDTLVEHALNLPRKERKEHIALIAHELRIWTLD